MLREQIYGGREGDECQPVTVSVEQHRIGNEIAEGEWERRMRSAVELGAAGKGLTTPGVGHRMAGEIYEEMISEAVAAGISRQLAITRAQSTLSRAMYGIAPHGGRCRARKRSA